MHQTLIRKLSICFVGLLLLIACTACKAGAPYPIKDYLNNLAIRSGIGKSNNLDNNFNDLLLWEIVDEDDKYKYNEALDYEYLSKTIGRLIDEDNNITTLKAKGWIDLKCKENNIVPRDIADSVLEKAIRQINDRNYENSFSAEYKKEIKDSDEDLNVGDILLVDNAYKIVKKVSEEGYELTNAEFDDVFESLDIEGSFEIDLSEAEIIPYGELEESGYVNEKYNLISNKRKVFNHDGFRISYSISKSAIDVHVSKEVNSLNVYGDLSIYNIKPTFKWTYEKNDLRNCFFSLKMNSTEKIGVSDGKYGNYYLNFKDLDSSSFKSLMDSMIDPVKDQVEASIPICKIKTPIPQLPMVYLNLDLLIKLYASGKAELVIYNAHNIGFETKNNQIRFINDHDNDFDSIIQASAKAGMGINVSLDTANYSLADIELDGGLKARLSTTIHLFDEEGDYDSIDSDIAYSTVQEISKENNNVKICGDVSFYWYMDLLINTAKTKMSKMGFSRSFNIMDERDQVFGNLHHLENGHFVERCTRKKKTKLKQMDKVKSNKIVLDSYAEVLKKGETHQIIIKSLPEGYTNSDIVYSSEKHNIASVSNGKIIALSPGSVKIVVSSSDGKYTAYVNILVSTE